MKAETLLDIIGSARDSYVADALEFEAKPRLRLNRLGLIAALVAVALLLTGCVAVVLHLQDKKVAESTATRQRDVYGNLMEPTQLTEDVIYPYARKESPMLLAAQEWHDYRFAPDMPKNWDMEWDESLPNNYKYIYQCANRDMAEKLDEIMAKYGLNLLTEEMVAQAYQKDILYKALGIDSVVRPDAKAQVQEHYGEFSPCGTFSSSLFFTLDEGWDREAFVDFYYAADGYFSPYYHHFSQEDTQWTYRTADGTTVLIAMRPDGKGTVFADIPGGSVTIDIDPDQLPETPYPRSESDLPTKEVLEQMADLFNYQIKPQPFDPAPVKEKLAAREQEYQEKMSREPEYAGFGEYITTRLNYLENWTYLMFDVDKDGMDEMLLHDVSANSTIALTSQDGVVTEFYNGVYSGIDYPCEGGYMARFSKEDDQLGSQEEVFFQKIRQTPEANTNSWFDSGEWLQKTDNGWKYYPVGDYTGRNISEEEAQAIRDKYVLLDIPEIPVLDFPMNGSTLGRILNAQGEPNGQEIRQIYRDMLANGEGWMQKWFAECGFYDIRDITGDGKPELLLGETEDAMGLIFTIDRRKAVLLASHDQIHLRKDHVIEITDPGIYHGGEVPRGELTSHTFYQFQPDGHKTWLGDYRLIKDTNSWINDQDDPIPATAYQELTDKYPLTELTLKPIAELTGT